MIAAPGESQHGTCRDHFAEGTIAKLRGVLGAELQRTNTMPDLLVISASFWMLTLVVGAMDGLYFHLWKLQLFRRTESRREHLAHGLRAVLMAPTAFVALCDATSLPHSIRVFSLLGLIVVDAAVGVWDVLLERRSRVRTGGLQPPEYLVHVVVTALHSFAEAFAIAYWMQTIASGARVAPTHVHVSELGTLISGASVVVAAVHFGLLHPRFDARHDAVEPRPK